MTMILESEIQAKVFSHTGEKRGEISGETFCRFSSLNLQENQRRGDDNKNKIFTFLRGGGGLGGQRGKSSKTLLFVGNATTIKF